MGQEIHNPILRLIEQYPATSSIVSAAVFFVLGLFSESKFKLVNKTKNLTKTRIIKKLFVIGNFGQIFNAENDLPEELKKPPIIDPPKYNGPLDRKQQEICEKIKNISSRHSESYNPLESWEKAKKHQNMGDIILASGTYVPMFRKIIDVFQYIAIENGANDQMSNLISLVNGLEQMLSDKDGEDKLKNQIGDCEHTIFILLTKMPI